MKELKISSLYDEPMEVSKFNGSTYECWYVRPLQQFCGVSFDKVTILNMPLNEENLTWLNEVVFTRLTPKAVKGLV